MLSSDPLTLLPYARYWAAFLGPPATLSGAAVVSDLADQFLRVTIYYGGVSARSVYSQEKPGAVTDIKSVIVLHTNTLYHAFCCALIVEKGGKVCFQTAGTCDFQVCSNILLLKKLEVGIYLHTSRYNISHFSQVSNVALFELHRNTIADFPGILVSIGMWP